MVSFATVIADACMLERVIEMDTRRPGDNGQDEALQERFGAARRGRGTSQAEGVQQRDVEGVGGQFWYEGAVRV